MTSEEFIEFATSVFLGLDGEPGEVDEALAKFDRDANEAEKKRALDMMSAELTRGPLAVAPVPGMSRKGGPAVQKVDAPLLQLRPPTEPTYGRKFREESDEP